MIHIQRAFSLLASVGAAMWLLPACDAVPDIAHERGAEVAMLEVRRDEGAAQSPSPAVRLIRDAAVTLRVSNLESAIDSLNGIAASVSGVVAGSEINSRSGERYARLFLRVPATVLDSVLGRVSLVGEVESLSTNSTDVSREYYDVETRLAVKEETVRRLTQLVQRSASVEDLVAVERELSRATTELESLKGQIRYFDQKIDQSEIRVHLTEVGRGLASNTLRPVRSAFAGAGEVLAESTATLVYLATFLLPWLLIGALGWVVSRRFILARRARTRSA